ncbi:SDR family oxidoreductase [Rubrobacter taiwanensis]|uniref:SDR family oxidoreductase n=1 Tax=Rubrobacter taiwanensis TaxID=185139 RepID=A0A4R1BFK0_9ACTN|nr:SDR family oxidoreductase [Rubrobacter taiwanensis]
MERRNLSDRFTDRVAIITGGASGIGHETAALLLDEGARVAIGDVREPRDLPQDDRILFVPTDVRSAADARRLVERTVERWGRVDILFNNAGTPGRLPRPPLAELSEEEWDETVDINLKGTFLCSRAVVPRMVEQGSGVIINNASMLGIVGMPESAAYCASKGGVVLLTKSMALELIRHNIRVNCVCASFIDTPMFQDWLGLQPDPEAATQECIAKLPIGRLGSPSEVARSVLFLASEESSYLVGHALYVDGGYLAQ